MFCRTVWHKRGKSNRFHGLVRKELKTGIYFCVLFIFAVINFLLMLNAACSTRVQRNNAAIKNKCMAQKKLQFAVVAFSAPGFIHILFAEQQLAFLRSFAVRYAGNIATFYTDGVQLGNKICNGQ